MPRRLRDARLLGGDILRRLPQSAEIFAVRRKAAEAFEQCRVGGIQLGKARVHGIQFFKAGVRKIAVVQLAELLRAAVFGLVVLDAAARVGEAALLGNNFAVVRERLFEPRGNCLPLGGEVKELPALAVFM